MMRGIGYLLTGVLCAFPAFAAPPGYFDLTSAITLESGDTWTDTGKRYRLYGLQSCLRGTTFTNDAGKKADCGEASMAMLAAFIKDTKPICAPTAQLADLTYVVCYANVAGNRLDLATILITEGFAFAALNEAGVPYHAPYAVAEQQARETRSGLWQFKDLPHPSIIIGRLAAQKGAAK